MKFEKIKSDIEANVSRWTKVVLECLPDNENRADILRLITNYEIENKTNLYFHWGGKTAQVTNPKLVAPEINEELLKKFKEQWKQQVTSSVPWLRFDSDMRENLVFGRMVEHIDTIDELKACYLEMTFTKDMKLNCFARKYYQGDEWIPKAGDYYTTTRNDLELYQVVEVTETEVHTSYLPLGGQVSKWPINEFTKEGFGSRRMFVPIDILCRNNVNNFRLVMYNSKQIPHYHQEYVEAYLKNEERQKRMKGIYESNPGAFERRSNLNEPLFEEDDVKITPVYTRKLLEYIKGKDNEQ